MKQKRNILKAVVAFIVALALVMSGAAMGANYEEELNEVEINELQDCGCEGGCELEIEVIHREFLGISIEIKNVGDSDCTNVRWSIKLDGGLIILGKETTGYIPVIPPGESATVHSDLIIGLGRTTIIISIIVDGEPPIEANLDAFLILFFIRI